MLIRVYIAVDRAGRHLKQICSCAPIHILSKSIIIMLTRLSTFIQQLPSKIFSYYNVLLPYSCPQLQGIIKLQTNQSADQEETRCRKKPW